MDDRGLAVLRIRSIEQNKRRWRFDLVSTGEVLYSCQILWCQEVYDFYFVGVVVVVLSEQSEWQRVSGDLSAGHFPMTYQDALVPVVVPVLAPVVVPVVVPVS